MLVWYPHSVFVSSLGHYSLEDCTTIWVKNWLTHWPQRILDKSSKSTLNVLTAGVSWGSVLASILLSNFNRDLEEELECMLVKVVNDTKLEVAVNITEVKIAFQRDLGKLEKWADRNFVKSNKDKSKVLWLGWSNPLQRFKLSTN